MFFVNRHTGGLETIAVALPGDIIVNRHTGGLEMGDGAYLTLGSVNRHTGGLEKKRLEVGVTL